MEEECDEEKERRRAVVQKERVREEQRRKERRMKKEKLCSKAFWFGIVRRTNISVWCDGVQCYGGGGRVREAPGPASP